MKFFIKFFIRHALMNLNSGSLTKTHDNSIKYSFRGNFPMGNILYAKEYEHSMPGTLRGQN